LTVIIFKLYIFGIKDGQKNINNKILQESNYND